MEKELLEQDWPEMKRLMETEGPDAVLLFPDGLAIHDQMDLEAMAAKRFYAEEWQGKSLDRYAEYAGRMITKYLHLAEGEEDTERAERYTQFANAQSYNLSANLAECWPEEAGQVKERRHFEWGLKLALRCIALRTALKKDALSMSRAYWLAGAHHLALHQWEQAVAYFTQAFRYASATPEGDGPLACTPASSLDQVLSLGYLGVALQAQGQGEGKALYDQAIQCCQAIAAGDEKRKPGALYFIQQLVHVKGLYLGRAEG